MASRSKTPLVLLALALVALLTVLVWQMTGEDNPDEEQHIETVGRTEQTASNTGAPLVTDGDSTASPLEVTDRTPATPMTAIVNALQEEGLTAFGRVTYPDDSPVSDIEVLLYDATGEYLDSIFSEEDGSFELSAGEPLAAGWMVVTDAPNYEEGDDPTANVPDAYQSNSPHAAGVAPVECHLVIHPAPRIQGRVTEAATGLPLDMAEVYVVSTHTGWVEEWQDVWTEEDGSYSLSIVNMPPSGLIIWCVGDEHAPLSFGPLDLAVGQIHTYDFALEPATTFNGIVKDARNLSPIVDADVTALPIHPEFEDDDAWDVTWEDGTFELDIVSTPLNQLWLYVLHEDYAPLIVPPDPFATQPRAILLHESRVVTGHVLDAQTEEPLDDAEIYANLSTSTGLMLEDYSDEAWLDMDGAFELMLENTPPSHGILTVIADGYYPLRAPLDTLLPAGNWSTHDLTLKLLPLPDHDDDG